MTGVGPTPAAPTSFITAAAVADVTITPGGSLTDTGAQVTTPQDGITRRWLLISEFDTEVLIPGNNCECHTFVGAADQGQFPSPRSGTVNDRQQTVQTYVVTIPPGTVIKTSCLTGTAGAFKTHLGSTKITAIQVYDKPAA
jgi:hypothetical protein